MAAPKDDYDYTAAIAEFHDSRAGIRGLVESGITAVPPLFLMFPTPSPPQTTTTTTTTVSIPTVDLSLPRAATIPLVRAAARSHGFFHVTNHSVPSPTIDSAISAVRSFHELPRAVRSALYSPTPAGGVTYCTIPNPSGHPASLPWRDTLQVRFGPARPDLGRVPAACRDALVEYHERVGVFGKAVAGLLSEGLGVGPERLERAMRVEGWLMACHYYPPCPEPGRVAGGVEHTDPSLFTVLAQDGVGGLQVRRDGSGEWLDVPPVAGALLVNVGDVLKIVSNDEYKSVEHRVVIKSPQDSRVSIALFYNPTKRDDSDLFEPLPELVTAEKPAHYRSFTIPEFMKSRREFGHGKSSVDHFKVV